MSKTISGNELIFAKVNPKAIVPTKRKEDAGYDIYTCEEETIVIEPHKHRLIDTGLAIGCSYDYFPKFFDKGGYGSEGITVTAGVGDSGYRDAYFIAMVNTNDDKTLVITNQSQEEINNANIFDKRDNLFKYSEGIELCYKTFAKLEEEGIGVDTNIEPAIVLKDDCIIKSLNKAITQFVMIEVPEMDSKEVNYDDFLQYKSERGLGKLGSSGK